jgi:hypothetical protein
MGTDQNHAVDDSGYQAIVDWLRTLPADTELVWGDNHTTTDGVHTGWVDVSVRGADLGFNWLWTIDSGTEPGFAADPTVIVVPHDRTLWVVWDTDNHWWLDEPAWSTAVDANPDPAQITALEAAIDHRPDTRSLLSRPGWSENAVNTALATWAHTHAGRGDLRFRYDPDWTPGQRVLDEAAATLEQIAAGTARTYELAPGVHATDTAFDQLLALDPDDAAAITAKLTGLRQALSDPDADHDRT